MSLEAAEALLDRSIRYDFNLSNEACEGVRDALIENLKAEMELAF